MPSIVSFSDSLITFASSITSKRTAVGEGGLLSGIDPTLVNLSDPVRLWIIQLAIIMLTAQLLSLLLRKMKQPRVISEVIGGIVLGPSLMGRVPGFTNHIFPKDSLPFLSLVANIGLVLFLFLVGLEIETTSIKRNARTSLIISMGGMILPFSIGAGMAKLIYVNYVVPVTPDTPFTHFMLFTCVAYSITAFPVLCRILTELKLLDTTVGICVLSAGVGNDIVGWTLLALSVALVNATSGLTALYIVLIAVAWALLIIFPIRKVFYILARKTDSLSNEEPSILFMTLTLIFVFASAFFTDVIGVHAIFGGFLAGLVVPRENGLAIKMTQKIEDLVGIVFLPLYFALSGLSTDLGLLNTGRIWGYTLAIIITAWFGKFVGASTGARLCGFGWREAGAVGELMSCKGLVELIVLNVGLQAGILSTLVFSMFVLEALVLTFFTTPGVVLLYPAHARVRIGKGGQLLGPTRTLEDGREKKLPGPRVIEPSGGKDGRWSSVTVILDRLEHLPGLICVGELLRKMNEINRKAPAYTSTAATNTATATATSQADLGKAPMDPLALVQSLPANSHMEGGLTRSNSSTASDIKTDLQALPSLTTPSPPPQSRGMIINALRLMELSERTSAIMKSILDSSSLILADPLLNIFRTIHELRGGQVRSVLKVEPVEEWAGVVGETVNEIREENNDERSELVVVCWLGAGFVGPSGGGHTSVPEEGTSDDTAPNPFDFFFNKPQAPTLLHSWSSNNTPQHHPPSKESTHHAHFIRSLFAKSTADVALFVDNSSSPSADSSPLSTSVGGHNTIFLPFFGGPDDRAALDMVVQICRSGGVRGVVVRVSKGERPTSEDGIEKPEVAHLADGTIGTLSSTLGVGNTLSVFPDTVYAAHTTATRLQSRTADELAWEKYTSSSSPDLAPSNVEFTDMRTPAPLEALITIAHSIHSQSESTGRMLIVVGRSRRLAVESHHAELKALEKDAGHGRHLSGEVRKTVGDVGSALVVGGIKADMLVLQAGHGSTSGGMEVTS